MKYSKLGLKWAGIYLGIFVVIAAAGIGLATWQPATSLLAGMLGILYTLPSSLIVSPLLDSLGYIAWYDQFVANSLAYSTLAMLGLAPAALLNAFIIYLTCTWYQRRNRKPVKT